MKEVEESGCRKPKSPLETLVLIIKILLHSNHIYITRRKRTLVSQLVDQQIKDYKDNRDNSVAGKPHLVGPSKIEFHGSSNQLIFSSGFRFQGSISFRGSNSRVTLGHGSMYRGRISLGTDCKIELGSNIYWGPNGYITVAEAAQITFGSDLLISENCSIRADDSHPIYDLSTGARINPSQNIIIGNHVWIGVDALVLPGSIIESGSIIGARSIVTSKTPVAANTLMVGAPVKKIRDGVHWERKHLQSSNNIPTSIDPEIAGIDYQ